jgi:hypothetical protein
LSLKDPRCIWPPLGGQAIHARRHMANIAKLPASADNAH